MARAQGLRPTAILGVRSVGRVAQTLGLLSLGHSVPANFTQEHLRLAKLLAIPAAAAIQNARLYECAKIFGTELKKSASDLQDAQSALQRLQSRRPPN